METSHCQGCLDRGRPIKKEAHLTVREAGRGNISRLFLNWLPQEDWDFRYFQGRKSAQVHGHSFKEEMVWI